MKALVNRINRKFYFMGILVLFTTTSLSADWPRHRGDAALKGNANSHLGKQLDLLWTYNTGEFLKSSVVAQNGVAFVGSEEGLLHAILLESGKKKWTFKTEMAIEAPPLLHEGQVIVGSTDGFLYSINQDTGKLNWKYETMGEIMGAPNQAIRPISKDDVLVVGSYDNFVHCVETKSGKN
jgi:outer membrane protein assembly factor BamB